jgi:hypothetical protein
MQKAITVMLDDLATDFSATLLDMGIAYDAETQSIFDAKLVGIFSKPPGELTKTAVRVFTDVPVRKDGVAFIGWLRARGFKVVLCVNRDIRLCYDITVNWLAKNGVQYDYLFTATSPAGLCMDMDIPLLVYNLPKGETDHIQLVAFADEQKRKQPEILGDFQDFEDVKQCVQKTGF